MSKWTRIKKSMERIEKDQRGKFSLFCCADYVAWVAKFHKVLENE